MSVANVQLPVVRWPRGWTSIKKMKYMEQQVIKVRQNYKIGPWGFSSSLSPQEASR